MKKRAILLPALTFFIASGVFAQSNFVSGEVSILGVGARYERVLTPYLTLGGNLFFNFIPTPFLNSSVSYQHTIISGTLDGRWYPRGRRFFVELGMGASSYISNRNYTSEDQYGNEHSQPKADSFFGFTITPGIGWTIDTGKAGGFFLSPGLKMPLVFTGRDSDLMRVGLGGTVLSVIISLGMGYAW